MSLRICGSCARHILSSDNQCPHCGDSISFSQQSSPRRMSMATALLFGFSLGACGDKDDTSSEPIVQPSAEPEYGVAMVDNDEDGFFEYVDDCDDNDPAINPDAEEICDDGVDNDCDQSIDADDPDCASN